jgi:hypothetical protein
MQYRQTMLQRTMRSLLGLVLASTCAACAPQLVGPTPTSGYLFTLEVFPSVIWLGVPSAAPASYPTRAEVVVRVRNGQGQPVDGVPVVFALEPLWAQSIVLSPLQTVTRHGVARAILAEPHTTGVVHMTTRVDNAIARTWITVQSYEERRSVHD